MNKHHKHNKYEDNSPFPYEESPSNPLSKKDALRILKNVKITGAKVKTENDDFMAQVDLKLINKARKKLIKSLKKDKNKPKHNDETACWVKKYGSHYCSNCDHKALSSEGFCFSGGCVDDTPYFEELSPYCPYCGMPMKE